MVRSYFAPHSSDIGSLSSRNSKLDTMLESREPKLTHVFARRDRPRFETLSPVIGKLRARKEWIFFGALPKADRFVAIAWWVVLVLRGVLPAAFAIVVGVLVARGPAR